MPTGEQLLAQKRAMEAQRLEVVRILKVKRDLVAQATGPRSAMGHAADVVAYEADLGDLDEALARIDRLLREAERPAGQHEASDQQPALEHHQPDLHDLRIAGEDVDQQPRQRDQQDNPTHQHDRAGKSAETPMVDSSTMSESTDQQRQWEKARERIDPPPQGPENEGDKAEPKHVEADPLPPITEG